jgi:hypothetical protein
MTASVVVVLAALACVRAVCVSGSVNATALGGSTEPTMSRPSAVELEAEVSECPPAITLRWRHFSTRVAPGTYQIWKRLPDELRTASPIAVLPANATLWTDANVTIGVAYEYLVMFSSSAAAVTFGGAGLPQGYVRAGISIPTVRARGRVLVVVEQNLYNGLLLLSDAQGNMNRLQQDLADDGWTVQVLVVKQNDTVASVKAAITGAYFNATAAPLKSLYLLGQVPQPYAGNQAPDGHGDHVGAWPCDSYYADVVHSNLTWLDRQNFSAPSVNERIRNNAGDTKFDDLVVESLELQVGRVDLSRLSVFAQSEVNLTAQYIDKAHRFRTAQSTFARRSFLRVNFDGFKTGQGPVRFLRPLFGDFQVVGADQLIPSLQNRSSLLSAGDGPGSYSSCGGVTTSAALAAANARVVALPLFGSYFGDHDVPNALLRVAIATKHTLVTWWHSWPGLPAAHQIALGATFGEMFNASQSRRGPNAQLPFPEGGSGGVVGKVFVNLHGDPTLRLFAVPPVSNLRGSADSCGLAELSWVDGTSAPTDDEAPAPTAYYEVLSEDWVLLGAPKTPLFQAPADAPKTFRVRAVRLETTKSGTFFNPSLARSVTVNAKPCPSTTTTATTATTATATATAVSTTDVDGLVVAFASASTTAISFAVAVGCLFAFS